jgi:hypothetical protein
MALNLGTIARGLALRFGIVFAALQLAPFPLAIAPWLGDKIDGAVNDAWGAIDANVGGWFGLDVVRHPTGSGDTLADFVQLAVVLAIAMVVAATWTAAMRARDDRVLPRLAAAMRIYLRYYLAFTMLGYGLAKVLPQQFGAIGNANLVAILGNTSPMGMLWRFMAVSRPYQVITGLIECVGGALLLSRRTTLVGALVIAGAMVNVVALNFCYDVPVKLYSTQLLVAAIVLIAPDARRLIAAVLARDGRAGGRPRTRLAGKAVMVVVIAYGMYRQVTIRDGAPTGIRYVWEVDRFDRDGVTLPPSAGDPDRWKLISVRSQAFVRTMDGEDHFHVVTVNDGLRLELGDAGADAKLMVELAGDHAVLSGRYEGHDVRVELHRADLTHMPLVTRGFHWVQEYPFNR